MAGIVGRRPGPSHARRSTGPKTASPPAARCLSCRPWSCPIPTPPTWPSRRDARFDGRLFVGVTSTGVYCRPVCRVRTPRRENCQFFATAARPSAGFRPLPALPAGAGAAGLSVGDDSSRCWRQRGARLIERARTPARGPASAIAARLGVTDRHLRRIFQRRAWRRPHRLPDDAAPAAGQAVADRHRAAGHAGGAGQRLRQPAPLQRGVRRPLPAEPDAACAGEAREAARETARCCAWPTGRPYDTDGRARLLRQRVVRGRAGGRPFSAPHARLAPGRRTHRRLAGRRASPPTRHEVHLSASRRRWRRCWGAVLPACARRWTWTPTRR